MDYHTAFHTSENRTAGFHQNQIKSVQAWKKPKIEANNPVDPKNTILSNLEKASDGRIGHFDNDIQTLNAYADAKQITSQHTPQKEAFTFGDVVNTVNPLHHIPLVGMAYRGVTGTSLHPMSHIIGGALYGGPIGAVSGTANAITKVQTGKDIGDHALSLVGLAPKTTQNAIEAQLTKARDDIEGNITNTLPRTASAFAHAGEMKQAARSYEKISMAEGRTAGHINVIVVDKNASASRKIPSSDTLPKVDLISLPQHQAITTLSLSALPKARDI